MPKRPTQKTRPTKGKPVEIPVPKRAEFEKALKRAERSKRADVPKQ